MAYACTDESLKVDDSVSEDDMLVYNKSFHDASLAIYNQINGYSDSRSINEEKVIKENMDKLVVSTKNLILNNYQVSEKDLQGIFGKADDERIVIAGIAIIVAYQNAIKDDAFKTRALGWADYAQCGFEALGVNVFSSARNVTKRTIIQILKEIGKRIYGPVGVAITVSEFGWCLYRS